MKLHIRPFLALALLSMMLITPLLARADEKITREDIENRRQEIVVKSMKFKDDDQKKAFLEVYVPYQERLMALLHQGLKLMAQSLDDEAKGKLTSQEANQLLAQSMHLSRERLVLQDAYAVRLRKILPPDRVLRAYQIENRLFAIWSVAASAIVPLAK